MQHHGWIVEVLIDIAKYSEKNGLTALHLEICALLQMILSLHMCNVGSEMAGRATAAGNVVHLADYARA